MENSGVYSDSAKQSPDNMKKKVSNRDKASRYITWIGMCLYRLRKFVLAIPVVYYALKLASYNMENLPTEVGINLQSTGDFTLTIARSLAVIGPLGLTLACLLLMFCSRKAIYPWAVSIFTLALPVLLLVSNVYPS